ncbi:uncharacterized protein LOC144859684 [Branchiostoma floridae x Branchiostoma japonicum]
MNSNVSSETQINYIKGLLEIDPFLDPDTRGFAEGISLSNIKGRVEDRKYDMQSTGQQTMGGYGDTVSFSEATRAHAACQVFRGQAEERANNGKPFPQYTPLTYQTQVVAGMNYKIRVDVSGPPGPWSAEEGIGPVRTKSILEMTVYWGLGTATPELKDAKMLLEPL